MPKDQVLFTRFTDSESQTGGWSIYSFYLQEKQGGGTHTKPDDSTCNSGKKKRIDTVLKLKY